MDKSIQSNLSVSSRNERRNSRSRERRGETSDPEIGIAVESGQAIPWITRTFTKSDWFSTPIGFFKTKVVPCGLVGHLLSPLSCLP